MVYNTVIYDTVIIGAGPAGITSAIQLKRSGFNILLIEKNKIGGLLRNANKIENYIGFSDGISAKELIASFGRQLSSFGIKLISGEVYKITKTALIPNLNVRVFNRAVFGTIEKHRFSGPKNPAGFLLIKNKLNKNKIFEVYMGNGTCYKSLTVIIATGTISKKARIPGHGNLCGKKVFYEIADIPLTNEIADISLTNHKKTNNKKEILIIGGGDAAFDYAINLHERGHKPSIIMRNNPTCLNLLLKTAKEKKILYFENTVPLHIYKDNDKITLECAHKTFKADFILIAVGREPVYPLIDCQLINFENNGVENNDGLFFAGDVKNEIYRQLHIAAGDAMQTAMKVQEYLKKSVGISEKDYRQS